MTRFQHLRLAALAAFLALASLRCSDKVDPDPVATNIEMLDGNGQTGQVGELLPNPLVVLVTDESGNPVEGVSVTWSAQGGQVAPTTTTTGSNGRASVQRTLGPNVGEQTTTATASGLTGSPVTFTSTAVAGPVEVGLAITTNPPVSALDGEVFDPVAQPVVVLSDGTGNPVAGAIVTASIAGGGGTLEGTTTATTDANGTAAFRDLGIRGTGAQTIEFTSGTASVTSSPVALTPLSEQASEGEWGPVQTWDIVPLHMSLLPNGKIFAWGRSDVADTMGMPRIWDPAAQSSPAGLPEIHVNDMLFCAGHTLMPDGRLMVAGGHFKDAAGIKVTYFFDGNGGPQQAASMTHGRWYPTLTVLPDGQVLSMAGRNETGAVVTTPELWNGSAWSQLTGAGALVIPYYPRNFVDPKNGLVFYAGERIMSRWFNVAGTGSWTAGPNHIYPFNRDYGTAVMYETGKILY
ncbi:MAG TPA: Ig-like domain-containing protein, partial [Gemmatimonadales bacterium]|nr:Ig-like domain-containing protein [Gemmatimonadales bacterium]